jgi:predicted nucleic acid-binding Zn ribbon protein
MCEKRNCIICDKDITYLSVRRRAYENASVCGEKCYKRFANDRRKNKNKSEIIECPVCGKPFVLTRSDKKACSPKCSNRLWYHTNDINFKIRNKKINNINLLEKDIEKLFNEMKRKSWYAEMHHIFTAIDLYDRIYPDRSMPESVESIFQRVIDWYIKQKD